MTQRIPMPDPASRQRPRGPWRLASLLGAIALQLGPPALAQDGNDLLRCGVPAIPAIPVETVAWMSGGIGEADRAQMNRAAADYNLQVVFSDRAGHYLADVPFSIKAHPAGPRYAAVSAGPLLYIRLPPGRYRIGARLDGAWQARQIRIGAAARPVRIAFVSAGR